MTTARRRHSSIQCGPRATFFRKIFRDLKMADNYVMCTLLSKQITDVSFFFDKN